VTKITARDPSTSIIDRGFVLANSGNQRFDNSPAEVFTCPTTM
jgi:hypothetical protein